MDRIPISDLLTLVRGATSCVTDASGFIHPETWQGLYYRDVRVLSQLRITIDGRELPLLTSDRDGASSSSHVHVVAAVGDEPTALLIRRRDVTGGVSEHFEVRVFSGIVEGAELTVELGSDFATLQATREGMGHPNPTPLLVASPESLEAISPPSSLTVHGSGHGVTARANAMSWRISAAPGRPWRGGLRFEPAFRGVSPPPADGQMPDLAVRSASTSWRCSIASAVDDLTALQVNVEDMDVSYIGAGVPWFMALFGRDTLITGYQSLITGTGPAVAVLRALARYQGVTYDAETLEQPGRILHEMRTGGSEVFGIPAGVPYYGTVDATPLFVMLLAEAHRWGAADDDMRALMPAARAAAEWCIGDGDIDGDGFIEYRADAGGLANQGWKDSSDAMVHADGTQARGPIALAEVQAYAYGAYLALAEVEERLGIPAAATAWRDRAAALQASFLRHFWLPEQGILAMALDGEKRPLAVANSNMGHCLWAGIVPAEIAAKVATRLAAPDLSTRWGVRTLGRDESGYNPLGYHRGTVWPHDTALSVAGMVRYGQAPAAVRTTSGLLEACEAFGWRLPELFAGLDVDAVPVPVPYAVACSPQAWSATAPLLLLTALLGLAPDLPAGILRVAPILDDDTELLVSGIRIGPHSLTLWIRGRTVEVFEAPAELTVAVD